MIKQINKLRAIAREFFPMEFRLWTRRMRREFRQLRRLLATLGAAVLTSVIPYKFDPIVTTWISNKYQRHSKKKPQEAAGFFQEKLSALKCEVSDEVSQYIVSEHLKGRVEIRWSQARGLGLKNVRPNTILEGMEHLEKALLKGNGAILWRMSFTFAKPINSSLQALGYPIVHLSSPFHEAMTNSWLGQKLVSPIFSRDEARYLKSRVVLDKKRPAAYMTRLKEELQNNGVVSVVGDTKIAKQLFEVCTEHGQYAFPSGAPSLSRSTGAALLPCVAIRVGPLRYMVKIMNDVTPDSELDKMDYRKACLQEYAIVREKLLLEYPASIASI